jgi:hypothetical protein
MKHLRKIYESENSDIKFSDIINVLYDLIDDDIPLTIISSTGIGYKPEDISRRGIDDIFKTKTWHKKSNFSIRIDENMEYSKLCDMMLRMKTVIGRFEDLGFILYSFYQHNDDTDKFSTSSIEYKFEEL